MLRTCEDEASRVQVLSNVTKRLLLKHQVRIVPYDDSKPSLPQVSSVGLGVQGLGGSGLWVSSLECSGLELDLACSGVDKQISYVGTAAPPSIRLSWMRGQG